MPALAGRQARLEIEGLRGFGEEITCSQNVSFSCNL